MLIKCIKFASSSWTERIICEDMLVAHIIQVQSSFDLKILNLTIILDLLYFLGRPIFYFKKILNLTIFFLVKDFYLRYFAEKLTAKLSFEH